MRYIVERRRAIAFVALGLTSLLSAGFAQAQPLPWVAWGDDFRGLVPGNNSVELSSVSHSTGKSVTLGSVSNSANEYWQTVEFARDGKIVWMEDAKFSPGSYPSALQFDGIGDVYVAGTYKDSGGLYQGGIIEYSPTGAFMRINRILTTSTLGINIFALGTDSNNDLFAAFSRPVNNSSDELVCYEYNAQGVLINQYVVPEIVPQRGFFDSSGSLFVSGVQSQSSPTAGGIVGRFSPGGTPIFEQRFNNGYGPTSESLKFVTIWPSPTPDDSFLTVTNDLLANGSSTSSFQVLAFDPTGQRYWTSSWFSGGSPFLSAGSPNDVYVQVDYSPSQGTFVERLTKLGAGGTQVFAMDTPQSLIAANGTNGVFLLFNNTSNNSALTLELYNNGVGSFATVQTNEGNQINGTTISNGGPDGIFIGGAIFNQTTQTSDSIFARFVSGLALKSVTLPNLISGNTVTGTVTLNGPATGSGFAVSLQSTPDLTLKSPTVLVPAGKSSATFTVQAKTTAQPETGQVTGEDGQGVVRSGTDAISPVGVSSVVLDNATIKGGNVWGATVTLTGVSPTGGTDITMTSDHPAIIPNATFTVDAGQTSAKVGDLSNSVNVDTTVKLTFTAPDGSSKVVTLTVTKS